MAVKKNDPYGKQTTNDELIGRRSARLDNEIQPDPELAEGPAGGGRITLFAIAIIAILGVVFYGLNNPSVTPITSTAQTTTTAPSTPATPPPGQTTGSATPPPSPPATSQPSDNANGNITGGSSESASTPSMNSAPSPSNGGTTQSGPPANN